LHDDLLNDLNSLSFSKELTEIRLNQIDLLTDVISNQGISKEDPKKFIEAIEKATWRSYLPLFGITYNELINAGNMSLIQSEELREKLAHYYIEIEQRELVLESTKYQQNFVRETAGILGKEMLIAIENSEPLGKNAESKELILELDNHEIERIIHEFSSNNEAKKWLPQLYHYHILAAKIIDTLTNQCKALLKSIEMNLSSRSISNH